MTENTPPSHLNESTLKLLALSDAERIERIRSPRWIGYPRAKEILAKLEDLLIHPKSHRMPNLLIIGDTNNGKTMLARRFDKLHPATEGPGGKGVSIPVMFIQAPPVPDEGRFYNTLLDAMFAPYKMNDRVDKKQLQVIKLLRYVNMKVLVIDEIHHILAGNMNKQRVFLNVIKYLGNELQVPIVGVGIKDAYRAIQTDPQLANRFDPAVLPLWGFDNEFLRLLSSFERMLPLCEPSNLHDMSLSAKIHSMCEGRIGELSNLLTTAAVKAVETRKERIDARMLDSIGWIAPSERKRQVDRLG
ncbi:MAG: TniB family NTP-binding protein [Pseudomonadota bacterium]